MRTIETQAEVGRDHKAEVSFPVDLHPGTYRLIIVVEEPGDRELPPSMSGWPVHDLGPWPEAFTARREELHDDDGR